MAKKWMKKSMIDRYDAEFESLIADMRIAVAIARAMSPLQIQWRVERTDGMEIFQGEKLLYTDGRRD
jgi:hypothetical protein